MAFKDIIISEEMRTGPGYPDTDVRVEVDDPTRYQMQAYTEGVVRDDQGGVVRVHGFTYPPGTMREFNVRLPSIRGMTTVEIGALVAAAELDYEEINEGTHFISPNPLS